MKEYVRIDIKFIPIIPNSPPTKLASHDLNWPKGFFNAYKLEPPIIVTVSPIANKIVLGSFKTARSGDKLTPVPITIAEKASCLDRGLTHFSTSTPLTVSLIMLGEIDLNAPIPPNESARPPNNIKSG